MELSMNELRIVESELGIDLNVLLNAIEEALVHAYNRVPGAVRGARVELNRSTGKVTVWAPEVDENNEVIGEFDDTPNDFGRIATSTARSIIAQRLRDAETDRVLGSFQGKKGQLVSGVVEGTAGSNPESRDLFIELGENRGLLRSDEQVASEHFKRGDLLRALVLDISVGPRGASIRLSRSHPDFVRQLLKLRFLRLLMGRWKLWRLLVKRGIVRRLRCGRMMMRLRLRVR